MAEEVDCEIKKYRQAVGNSADGAGFGNAA